jgi:ubiquinone/menaquinone biosynthesis C-methylase UbiE
MSFEDLFSKQAEEYAQYRPRYPDALFEYLASVAPGHALAWDCATGNGQAALSLAAYFERVIGTDASENQIANAEPHEKITYRVARAEQTDFEDHSVDLITVAQAIHWFDLDAFYAEAKRVLKPGGVLAVWTYHESEIEPTIDGIVTKYQSEVVGPYWSARIELPANHYRTLPFPFQELDAPIFVSEAEWDLNNLVGFFQSWSATQTFIEQRGYHPVKEIEEELVAAWGSPEQKRRVRWTLFMRVGRER